MNRMNLLKTTLIIIIAFLSVCSCEQADPNEKGRIIVMVYYDGNPVENAIVSMATSQKNLNMGVYTSQVHSNSQGIADFGALLPGNYYCDAFKYINNNKDYLYGALSLIVEPGHRKTLNIELEKK